MIRVLIADDHPIVRRGLAQILEETPDIAVGGEAGDGQTVLAKVHREHYDLVLLDIALPDRHGLDILAELRHQHPKLPVLILSVHPEEQYALRCLRAGAAGYLTKDSAPDELVGAIRHVAAGGRYISPGLAELLATHLLDDAAGAPHTRLSNREFQVLRLLANGETPAEIADHLALSPKTVSTYRRRILQKLGLRNNAELIRYAVEHDLVP